MRALRRELPVRQHQHGRDNRSVDEPPRAYPIEIRSTRVDRQAQALGHQLRPLREPGWHSAVRVLLSPRRRAPDERPAVRSEGWFEAGRKAMNMTMKPIAFP